MKKKLVRLKRKVNNAGMTLIEILVAMALLVVAIIPLSAGYIYSAKHSAKAKHMQQSSVLAHTMIENCKAFSYKEIDDMVTVTKDFMPNTTAANHYKDTSVTDGRLYYFNDVLVYTDESGVGSTQIYDLSMRITPVLGMEKNLMLYSDMNKYSNAFMLPATTSTTGERFDELEQNAYQYIVSQISNKITTDAATHTGLSLKDADISSIDTSLKTGANKTLMKMQRIITVTAADSTNETVTVKCEYKYSYSGEGKYKYKMQDAWGNVTEYKVAVNSVIDGPSKTFNIYSNSTTGANAGVKDIYLFFYPSYNNLNIDCLQDQFVINNTLGRDVNVYLMKQCRQDMTDTEIANAEGSYNPVITGSTDTGTKIKLFHNLYEPLKGTSTIPWAPPAISPDIEYQDFDSDPSDSVHETLVNDMDKQLMYKVEVGVYSKDAFQNTLGVMSMTGEPLCTMDGTFLDW